MLEEEKKEFLFRPLTGNNIITKNKREKKIPAKTVINSPFFILKKITNYNIQKNIIIIPKKIGGAVARNYIRRITKVCIRELLLKNNSVGYFLVIFHTSNQQKLSFSIIRSIFLQK